VSSDAALQHGRERLLAQSPGAAEVFFVQASRWPTNAGPAAAGRALARAATGRLPEENPSLSDLAPLEPVAVLDAALERGDLAGARAIAALLTGAGHPLGPLYGAAVALERGDEVEARRLAADSPVPLRCREVGRRVAQALEARDGDATSLVRDRRGALVGWLDREGRLTLADGVDPLLVPPYSETPARRRRRAEDPAEPPPYWLPPRDVAAAARTGGLRLTLDLDLARLALDSLGRWRGTIVLLEPRTGAILAAVSDPRTIGREGPAAFTQRREPASISKVITAAAAYRNGIDAQEAISRMTCRGVERYGGQPLWCSWKAGDLAGLDHALAISCNIAFANLGILVGHDGLLGELRRWGFDADEGAMMGAAGRVHTLPRTPRQLADLSVGLTVSDITPLHAALLATVVANGGTMPAPRLVTGACGPVGVADPVAVLVPARRVIDPETVPPLRRAMQAVALYGTGAGLAPRGFPIAMKTGTAAEYRKGYHVNYIGLAPTPDASVVFCVRITYRPNSRAVNRAAREVTAALLAGLADRRDALVRDARRQRAHAAWPVDSEPTAPDRATPAD
jgi:peptidoglycan glycosyltransferase